jgi:uncharacterized protein (DUF1800 family)
MLISSVLACCCLHSYANLGIDITNGQFCVVLPAASSSNDLRIVEWSTDLKNWQPVVRDYAGEWENTFPHALNVSTSGVSQVVSDPTETDARFYRMSTTPTALLNNSNSVSRFLQQATFGPTRELIINFPGLGASDLNNAPYTNYANWINAQLVAPTNSHRAFWRERSDPSFTSNPANAHLYEVGHNPTYGTQLTYYLANTPYKADTNDAINIGRTGNDVTFNNQETRHVVWYQMAITADDHLRQKMAWALSQIFVVGQEGSSQPNYTERWLTYYDIFVRHAFGNFRDILGEVTYSPHMTWYLTYDLNSSLAYDGNYPDENYAREVMQLFTIGLWKLNQDGTFVLDSNGELIPTYSNSNITEFAKVFTGLRRENSRPNIEPQANNNYIDPAKRVDLNRHDFSAKTLLDGSTLGPFSVNEAGVFSDIDGLLDHLFNHDNTPPFIARKLIQRFTVSNPSPQYIYEVAEAFIDNGSGIRGDLGAVVKAILLHPEARESAVTYDPAHGRLREPLLRLMSYARAFEITSPQTYGFFPFHQMDEYISQSPYDYPSVFNFYRQDFQPLGEILDRSLYAPEFQIHDDITALRLPNAIHWLVYEGIQRDGTGGIGQRWYSQGDLDLTFEKTLASDTDALMDHLDKMITAGRLSAGNRVTIKSVIDLMQSDSDSEKEALVQRALWLMALTPEFNVLY